MNSLELVPQTNEVLNGLEMIGPQHRIRYCKAVQSALAMGWGYYFPHLLAHNKPGKSAILITEEQGSMCVFRWTKKGNSPRLDLYLPPVPFQAEVMQRCLERANEYNGDRSAQIMRVDTRDATLMEADGSLRIRPRREQYLFVPANYESLAGKQLYTIRRNVAQVEKLGEVRVAPFAAEHATACLELLTHWKQQHQEAHGTAGGAGVSKRAIELACDPRNTDLRGELVFIDGKLVAFAFGGEIRPGLACSFDRKCDTSIRGLSYHHFRSFLLRLGDFDLVNDGSDTGRGGLRQLKESFRPVNMHTEYRVSQKRERKLRIATGFEGGATGNNQNNATVIPLPKSRDPMRVGLLCNFKKRLNPVQILSPSLLNRAIMLGEDLSQDGIELFLFSPRDVTRQGKVSGYVVKGREFRPDKKPVPRMNANWTYGTRKLIDRGMGYEKFKRWAGKHKVDVYVPYEFAELVANKCDTYRVIREHQPDLYPRTEDFAGTEEQIEAYLKRSGLVFIKPRAGNKGNKIFVLRQSGADYSLRYYHNGVCRLLEPITIGGVLAIIDIAKTDKSYCIQDGIESLQIDGSVFDVRVVMVNDGDNWHSILETRLAPPGSDLSNVYQGGSIHETEELFKSKLGAVAGHKLAGKIRQISHGVARHLGLQFPGRIMELGLDLIVDQDFGIHLVEVNAKPGVSGMASEKPIFDWQPEDAAYYEKSVREHVRHLANFIRSKLTR
jgi:hypothetical protein